MEETGVAPTLAAEGETQNLLAWSQGEAPTDLIEYRGRGWKLPLLAALVAVGALVGLGFYVWPHYQSAGNVQVAPAKPQAAPQPQITASPPVQAQSPDQRFIALIQQRGIKVVSPPAAIKGAHDVCRLEAEGHSAREIAQGFVDVTPGASIETEGVFVMTAEEVYCPR